jgi:hypothetical protein
MIEEINQETDLSSGRIKLVEIFRAEFGRLLWQEL